MPHRSARAWCDAEVRDARQAEEALRDRLLQVKAEAAIAHLVGDIEGKVVTHPHEKLYVDINLFVN